MEVGEINVPNTGITLDNNTKFYYSDIVINGTVIDKDLKDVIQIHYTVDGTEYTLPPMSTNGTSQEFSLDLTSLNLSPVTNHTLKVWAVDSTGCESNVEERNFTITYLKNPEISVSKEEWTNEDVTFKIVDEENEDYVEKYQYRINEGEWVDCEKETDFAIEETGIVKIDVRIVGSKSGDYSDIVTKYAKIDKVAPSNTAPSAIKTTCTITVIPKQTDSESGIDTSKILYAIKDGDNWSSWQENNKFEGLVHNKEYIIKTKATDLAGNTSESEEISIKTEELKLGKLVLKLNNSEGDIYNENTWTNQNIYVTVEEIQENVTTKYKSKEESAQTILETNQETTVTKDGSTILLVFTTDGTNTIESEIEHILKIDKIKPVINSLVLDNDEWSAEHKQLTGKAIDTMSGIIAYQFSNQDNITITSEGWNNIENTIEEITKETEVTEGENKYFYVKDAAGNIAFVSINTKIDSIGPIITFEKTSGKTIINVTDAGAGVKKTEYAWTTNNEEPTDSDWNEYEGSVTYDGNYKGKIYLWAKSVDNVGNETISSISFEEISKPKIIAEDEFINKYIEFKIDSESEEPEIVYQFKINDGEWQDITKNSTHKITNIEEGEVKISTRSLDSSGRYSETETKIVKVLFEENNADDMQNSSNNSNDDNDNNEDNSEDNKNISDSDDSLAPTKLPYTGKGIVIIISITTIIGVGIFGFIKYMDLKDI